MEEALKEIERLKKENIELKEKSLNNLKKYALKNLKTRFQPSLIEFISLIHEVYVKETNLAENQAAMLRRTWLLSHFGIVFNDFQKLNFAC